MDRTKVYKIIDDGPPIFLASLFRPYPIFDMDFNEELEIIYIIAVNGVYIYSAVDLLLLDIISPGSRE